MTRETGWVGHVTSACATFAGIALATELLFRLLRGRHPSPYSAVATSPPPDSPRPHPSVAVPPSRPAPQMRVQAMPRDGNCLFHSLAYPHGDHREVRARVAQRIVRDWDAVYSSHVPEKERAEYLRRMHDLGTWGDELSLRAFSDAARMSVEVYENRLPFRRIAVYGAQYRADPDAPPPRRLLFGGGHYDALLPSAATRRGEA